MTSHRWQTKISSQEEVFVCIECGCSGGPSAAVTTKEPRPYMVTVDIPVADDCLVAQQQTKYYVLGRLSHFQLDAINSKNEVRRTTAWLLERAIELSPKATNFAPLLRVLHDAEGLSPSDLRQRLVVAGFHVPPASQ